MTDKDLFTQTIKDELPRFERVFKALEKLSAKHHTYKHDPKSRTAFELAVTMTSEFTMFPIFLKKGNLDFMKMPKPKWKTFSALRVESSKQMKAIDKMVTAMKPADWEGEAKMSMGGKDEWKTTKSKMAWGFLLDLIHHRGQLSTYIRPMGGKVPSIYGPSADSK